MVLADVLSRCMHYQQLQKPMVEEPQSRVVDALRSLLFPGAKMAMYKNFELQSLMAWTFTPIRRNKGLF
jgi:hypothetical protein